MRKSNKRSRPWQRQPGDRDEAAEVEARERLLLSALKFWEVERDLIDERMDAIGVRQSDPVQVLQDNPYNGNLIQPVIPHW